MLHSNDGGRRALPARKCALIVGAVVALRVASAAAQPRMPTHVACVGDSITAGTGATSTATNYPSDLQGLFGSNVKVQNFGVSGATMLSTGDKPWTKQAQYAPANTFVSNAGASAAVDVIIMLGTNDSKPANWNKSGGGTQSQQFATDCAALIDHFTGLSTHPVVYLALPLAAFSNSYTISGTVIKSDIIPVLQQVAAQKGVATIDLNTPTAGHPEYLTDGVHPNDNGYKIVAQTMHDGLLRIPRVSISGPLTGAVIAGSVVNVAATASGGNVPITSVQFLLGTTVAGSALQTPFNAALTGVPTGSYALTARATDETGAAATSDAVQISVMGGASAGMGGAAGGSGVGASGSSGADSGGAAGVTFGGGDVGGLAGLSGASTGGASTAAMGGSTAAAGSGTGGTAAVAPGSAGASAEPSGATADNGSGCSCHLVGRRGAAKSAFVSALLLLGLGVRRRRRLSLRAGMPVRRSDSARRP